MPTDTSADDARATPADLARFLNGDNGSNGRGLATLPDQPPQPAIVVDDDLLPGKLTRVSYRIKRGLSFKRYTEVMATLAVMYQGHQWWIGDALNDGEEMYGQKYNQALDATTYSYGTLRNFAAVAKRIPANKRNPRIPFSHYQAAMQLADRSPAAAIRLVEHARDVGMSTRQIRSEAQGLERQLDEREQANGLPSTRPPVLPPLDPPRITIGQHRDVCRSCTCPVLDDE